MHIESLVFGLLDASERIATPALAARLRSLTISWSRFGYHDAIIEADSVESILDEAAARGFSYCLIQAYGHVICENWYQHRLSHLSFQNSLRDWIEDREDFFVTGHILDGGEGWYGLSDECLLVNLKEYEALGRPRFGDAPGGAVTVSRPIRSPEENAGGVGPLWLKPSGETETRSPSAPGWGFVDASLRRGKVVYSFSENVCRQTQSLYGGARAQSPDSRRDGFLKTVDLQLENGRRGVFLWNLEPYTDVEEPPGEFKPPLSALYSVASGFKPNMILRTHGADEQTRVVFFDYSPKALEVKKLLHREWDGEDYPRFVRYVFEKFPAPETFYQLWADASPENLNWEDANRYWQDEIDRWGGERAIKEHWAFYRGLEHEYVLCDLLTEGERLLKRIEPRPGSVIWWSNAFASFYSNWFYTIDERKRIYDEWVCALAAKHPSLFLYGADYNNISVNCIQAGAYLEEYSRLGGSYLDPHKWHRHEIRS